MSNETTCWTIIDAAAAGKDSDREAFARRYAPIIQAYLAARWRSTRFVQHLEDATQDVFVECFRAGGPLERADRKRPGGFHAFLYAIVRNVALRTERNHAKYTASQKAGGSEMAEIEADETSLSRVFDRAWATGLLEEAANRQAARRNSKRRRSSQTRGTSCGCVFRKDYRFVKLPTRGRLMPRGCTVSTPRLAMSFRKPCVPSSPFTTVHLPKRKLIASVEDCCATFADSRWLISVELSSVVGQFDPAKQFDNQ